MTRSTKQTTHYRERAAECASLASTANMAHTRDEYQELARHYLVLAEAENRKSSPAPLKRRKTGRSIKFGRALAHAT